MLDSRAVEETHASVLGIIRGANKLFDEKGRMWVKGQIDKETKRWKVKVEILM